MSRAPSSASCRVRSAGSRPIERASSRSISGSAKRGPANGASCRFRVLQVPLDAHRAEEEPSEGDAWAVGDELVLDERRAAPRRRDGRRAVATPVQRGRSARAVRAVKPMLSSSASAQRCTTRPSRAVEIDLHRVAAPHRGRSGSGSRGRPRVSSSPARGRRAPERVCSAATAAELREERDSERRSCLQYVIPVRARSGPRIHACAQRYLTPVGSCGPEGPTLLTDVRNGSITSALPPCVRRCQAKPAGCALLWNSMPLTVVKPYRTCIADTLATSVRRHGAAAPSALRSLEGCVWRRNVGSSAAR